MGLRYKSEKIINIESNGKLANIISIKHKGLVNPGEYFMVWVPNVGESSVAVLSSDNLSFEILTTKKNEVIKKIFNYNKKGDILIKGPFGHGFPLNNLKGRSLVLMGESSLFSPLWFLNDYVNQNKKDFKDVVIDLILTNPKKAFSKRISNLKDTKINIYESQQSFLKELVNKSEPNKVYLLSLSDELIKKTVKELVLNKVRKDNIYFYIRRKISCGEGICGKCMDYGKHICKDGPVFRSDQLWRFIEDD